MLLKLCFVVVGSSAVELGWGGEAAELHRMGEWTCATLHLYSKVVRDCFNERSLCVLVVCIVG